MDFEVGGVKYRAAKMDAFSQFHVARKLAPVFAAMGGLADVVVAHSVGGEKGGDDVVARASGSALAKLTEAVSQLSDDDSEAVLIRCLSVVSRITETAAGASLAPVWSVQAKRFMFADIGLMQMIQIAVHVIQDSLADFTGALPSGSIGSGA